MTAYSSIVNSVLGPVMRGPSSSHTAASVRIGHLARSLMPGNIVSACFTFDPSGSLASTYRDQGSAMGLAGGLLGMEITDTELVNAELIASSGGLDIKYMIEALRIDHPNAYSVELCDKSGRRISFIALSTGGGRIRLVELNGKEVTDDSRYIEPLMTVSAAKYSRPLFITAAEGMAHAMKKGMTLPGLAIDYETSIWNIDSAGLRKYIAQTGDIMERSIADGKKAQTQTDNILPHQSDLLDGPDVQASIIPGDLTNSIISSITAVMESKSSFGLIVAAPTAGSCGTLPGTLFPVAKAMGKSREEISDALLAAGIAGVLIESGAGFAAEEGGCQYECGSASAMTAAALAQLISGNAEIAVGAASMALQNMLGSICDPVANRVEVPCLGKNIMAGMNALASANMAVAGYDPVIPFDEVISAMAEVGNAMDHKYRCTCKGGLSLTPTAKDIELKLKRER